MPWIVWGVQQDGTLLILHVHLACLSARPVVMVSAVWVAIHLSFLMLLGYASAITQLVIIWVLTEALARPVPWSKPTVVLVLPSLQLIVQLAVLDFSSNLSTIRASLASIHVPVVLSRQPTVIAVYRLTLMTQSTISATVTTALSFSTLLWPMAA